MVDKTPIEATPEIDGLILMEVTTDEWIEKGRQMVIEAGDTYCLDGVKHGRDTNYANVKKRECRKCWQALKGGKNVDRCEG